ncbi:MAG: hypothetical protein Q4F85_09765 [Prevotella sp.]|nr:hypothetical protein [Prevotella sp.]MDO5526355.1 hypothetical protein [Prevotella sp.]
MKKNVFIPLIVIFALLLCGIGYLAFSLNEQKAANEEMQELAALDKKEMENEYEQFALQYSEMKTKINNDSIIAQLTQEQMRTQELLEELKQVKSSDAREIARLKKELATVRKVLRSYVMQIDSLNRLNEHLSQENTRIKAQNDEANRQIAGLSSEKASLSEKVAIAAQLDATGISMTLQNKKGKAAKKVKDAKTIVVNFTIARNVTAANGVRTLYVRIQTPNGDVLNGGSFNYENRTMAYSMKKAVEYTGEAVGVTTYWNVGEFLQAGTYIVSIFADGNMIGSRSFSFNK